MVTTGIFVAGGKYGGRGEIENDCFSQNCPTSKLHTHTHTHTQSSSPDFKNADIRNSPPHE